MTSASELFHSRRSRFGRNSIPVDLGPGYESFSHLDRSNRQHRHSDHHHYNNNNNNSGTRNSTRRDRLELEGCDPLRRHPHQSRHHPLLRSSFPPQELDSSQFDQGSHQFALGNVNISGNGSTIQDRLTFSGNGRLPGAVLLARERLLQRLRGVALSGNRSSPDVPIGDDFRLVDAGDWETEISIDWLASISPVTDSTRQQTCQRPPGLTEEALNCLCVEIFSVPDEGDEPAMSRSSMECSICLESFCEGDELICLPCGHRFHLCCLDPWIRTCGDCPYCRRGIVVTTDGVKERQ